jgi:YD repeat-containing protein
MDATAKDKPETRIITFQGALAATNVSQMTINVSGLSVYPSGPPSAVQTTNVQGGVYSEVQSLVLANATGGTWRLAYDGEVTSPLAYNASAGTVETALEALTGIDNVTVSGSSGSFTVTFGGTQANTGVSQILGDAANALSGSTVRTITTAYNAASEITSVTDPDSTITYTRDNLGRATGISNVITGLTPTVALTQAFDAANNRTELKATSGGTLDFKNTYTFDALQRMTDVVQQSQSGGNAVTSKHVKFSYNALGQQTSIARYQSTGTTNAVATSTFTYSASPSQSSNN